MPRGFRLLVNAGVLKKFSVGGHRSTKSSSVLMEAGKCNPFTVLSAHSDSDGDSESSTASIEYFRRDGRYDPAAHDDRSVLERSYGGREWVANKRPGTSASPDASIRIASYNVLAQYLIKRKIYSYSPNNALKWAHRKQQLMSELRNLGADVLCLQEVDRHLPMLVKQHEYDVVFAQRPKPKADGCAIAVRCGSGIDVLSAERLEFSVDHDRSKNCALICLLEKKASSPAPLPAVLRTTALSSSHILSEESSKDSRLFWWSTRPPTNVAPFRPSVASSPAPAGATRFVVVSLHLFWNPEHMEVKLEQLKQVMERLRGGYSDYPVMLCGDFNSTPESEVYRRICEDHGFASAYSTVLGAELPYTNYKDVFNDTLDYIFVKGPELSVESVLGLPSHALVTEHTALPNLTFSSDHLSIACNVSLNGNIASIDSEG